MKWLPCTLPRGDERRWCSPSGRHGPRGSVRRGRGPQTDGESLRWVARQPGRWRWVSGGTKHTQQGAARRTHTRPGVPCARANGCRRSGVGGRFDTANMQCVREQRGALPQRARSTRCGQQRAWSGLPPLGGGDGRHIFLGGPLLRRAPRQGWGLRGAGGFASAGRGRGAREAQDGHWDASANTSVGQQPQGAPGCVCPSRRLSGRAARGNPDRPPR